MYDCPRWREVAKLHGSNLSKNVTKQALSHTPCDKRAQTGLTAPPFEW